MIFVDDPGTWELFYEPPLYSIEYQGDVETITLQQESNSNMINVKQLRAVIKGILKSLDPVIPYSEDAVELLLLTAAHESKLGTYMYQVKGPAIGLFQMEPMTFEDIHFNYLRYKSHILNVVPRGSAGEMMWDHKLAIVMARVHYYRVPSALPTDTLAMAEYAKEHWNTSAGKATVQDYLDAYRVLVLR